MTRSLSAVATCLALAMFGCGGATPTATTGGTAGSTGTTGTTASTSAASTSGHTASTTGTTTATATATTSSGTATATTSSGTATATATTSNGTATATTSSGTATATTSSGTATATTSSGTATATATTSSGTATATTSSGTATATTSGGTATATTSAGTATAAATTSSGTATATTSSGSATATTSAGTTSGTPATTGSTTGGTSGTTGSTTGSTTGGSCPADGTVDNSGCTTVGATSCDTSTGNVLTCSSVTAGGLTCVEWTLTTDCATSSLTCQTVGGVIGCYCAPNTGSTFYADPNLGSDSSPIVPSGIQDPPQCRFATLGHALAVAAAATPPASALATGFDGGNGPLVFGSETYPLVVPADVTLSTTDSPLTPADYVIPVSGLTDAGIFLINTSAISGFTILDDGGIAGSSALYSDALSANAASLFVTAGTGVSLATGVQVAGTGATLTLDSVTVEGFSADGILVGPGASAAATTVTSSFNQVGVEVGGTFTGTTLNVSNSGTYGVLVDDAGSADVSALTLTSNGAITGVFDAGYAGVLVLGGAVALAGANVQLSGGPGLLVTAGDVYLTNANFDENCSTDVLAAGISVTGGFVDGGNVTASSNTCVGIGVARGNVYLDGVTAELNTVEGVELTSDGAVATLVNPTLNQNGNRGLYVVSGTATVSGAGTISGNGTVTKVAGVRADRGSLTMGGATTSLAGLAVEENGAYGVHLMGATSTLTGLTISKNGSNGVDLTSNVNGGTPTTTISTCTIETNDGDGIAVHASPNPQNGGDTFAATGNTISQNASDGIALLADAGSVGADLATNIVSSNTGAGISIFQSTGNTTDETLQGNQVFQNGATAGATGAPGIHFATASTLNSFTSNAVYANGADQVLFSAASNALLGTWDATGGSAASCKDANQFYCYTTGFLGVSNASGSTTGIVTANYDSWQNSPPSAGVDYSSTGVTVTKNDYCNFTPPTCP